jgi:hypothetical protein
MIDMQREITRSLRLRTVTGSIAVLRPDSVRKSALPSRSFSDLH